MDFFTQLTLDFLVVLKNLCGSYGLAIIVLTIIVRMLLWPLSVSQQRSMKVMQALQPKMKMIQEKYKNQPDVMQKKMMEFYKENKFNPMGGCLPLLLQMPIFILLYTALISPQFIDMAGDAHFGFIKRLDATIHGTSAKSFDGTLTLSSNDRFTLKKDLVVYFNDNTSEELKLTKTKNAVEVQGEAKAGEPIDLKIAIDVIPLKFAQLSNIKSVDAEVSNMSTRETEKITFERNGDILTATVPTVKPSSSTNYDVILLVVIFGASMFVATKVMTLTNKNKNLDPQQEQMQKTMGVTMPIFLTATFFFIPIPAGVLLYLVVSNLIQILQTFVINKQLEVEETAKSNIIDVKPEK